MRLVYVKLWNIRSYTNEKIDFPEGSVLLSGDIGSGKSTILLAIEFALFGIKRGEFSGSSILRNGADEGLVELKFILDGEKEVVVQRKLKRTQRSVKQESGFVMINRQKLEGTPVELKSRILEMLGYPTSLISKGRDMIYRYTVYTPQADMNRILFSDNEERLDTLRRVFNIDRYKRVRENLQLVIRNMKGKIANMEGRIQDLPEKSRQRKKLISEINEIIREAKSIIPKIKDVSERLAESTDSLESLEKKNEALIEEKKNLEYLKKEKGSLEDRQTKLEKEIAKINKDVEKIRERMPEDDADDEIAESLARQIEEKRRELESSKENNSLISQRLSDLKDEIKRLEDKTSSKKRLEKDIYTKKQQIKSFEVGLRQKSSIEKDIEKIEKILVELNNRLAECGVNHANAKKVIDDISELSDCPTCHQKVTEEYKKDIIKKKKDEMKSIEAKKKEHEQSIDGYKNRLEKSKENLRKLHEKETALEKERAELSHLEESMREFDSKRNRLEELKIKHDKMKADLIPKDKISELAKELDTMLKRQKRVTDKLTAQKEIRYMEDSRKKYEDEVASSKERLSSILQQIKTSEDKIESMKYLEKEITALKKTLEAQRKEEKELMMQKTSLLSQRDSMMKTKESLDEEIIEKRSIKEKIDRMLELRTWLSDYFSEITLLMERSVMSRIFGEFDELFREWFNIMIEDEVISVRLDEEFTPIVEQNGYEMSLEDLSGGEKTSCALAYRLALNKVINDCIDSIKTRDLIMLDEPTDGFSSEQLDRLRDVLGKLNISQVIIVSHEAKIESYVDNVLRISKSEHVSSLV
ncbi:MAG: AAA family ATPase [Candidatus Woesearchaeota archaeon]